MTLRRPFEVVDYQALMAQLPPPPQYFESVYLADPSAIAARQLTGVKERARRAAMVPFFERLWRAAGVGPDDIDTLDDLWRFPTYSVEDIRRSIERQPPWGDYQGVYPADATTQPMRVYLSGGTTGKSRPTFYTQWDRDAGAIFTARLLWRSGVRPGDVVLNSYLYSTHNGAAMFDEALHRWMNCVVLTTSSGNVTATERQVEMAVDYGASAIVTTGDHLLRIADVAESMGYAIGRDLKLRAMPGAIGDADKLEARFGLEMYHSYGFHEVNLVAVECPEHDGLHIFEDAYVVQVVDPETGERLADGQLGSLVVTEFWKTGSPQFRYNTMDLSYLYPPGRCRCGSWMRRIGRFAGRGDNMVKLRGINIWPEAVGAVALAIPGVEADYFVRVRRVDERDEMTIAVVSALAGEQRTTLAATIERALQTRFGLKIAVDVTAPGGLDELTQFHTSPKPMRFRDERK